MRNRLFYTALLGLALTVGPAAAQVYVRIGPPPPVVERPGPVPRPGYVWIGGYHRWDGRRYVWVPGHYVAPPRHYHRWIPGHWAQGPRGYYWVEGHWVR